MLEELVKQALVGTSRAADAKVPLAPVLEATIAALRGSTSWKVTAPLRVAGLAMKRAPYSAVGYPVTLGLRALTSKPNKAEFSL